MARAPRDEYLGFDGDIPPPHRLSNLYNSPAPAAPYSYPSYSDAPLPSVPSSPVPTGTAALGTPRGYHPYQADETENPLFMPSAQFASNTEHAGYSNMEYGSAWNEKSTRSSSRSKWIVLGSIIGIAAIIGVAVGVGVGVSKSKSGDKDSASSSSGDASNFAKDDRLKQSFYGFAYTPEGSQLPDCGNNLTEVIKDIQLLSQLTTRIRLYGADCNQSALVLEAIKQTNVDMDVYLGIYNIPTDAGEAYVRQRDTIKEALQTYGSDHVAGVTVGNEFMLNWMNSQSATSSQVNQAIGDAGAELLIQNITDFRNTLSDLGMNIQVGTSDAGAFFNDKVLAAVDYGMANVHPWFANTTIDDAASWTAQFFEETDVQEAAKVSNNPTMYIAETGWPTDSSNPAEETNGASEASTANLQKFLDTFVCQANTNGTGYFFFEYADEPWKDATYGGVEGWWGLFTSDRQLKDVTIPTCS